MGFNTCSIREFKSNVVDSAVFAYDMLSQVDDTVYIYG